MITQDIRYLGVNDKDLDLFEGQYAIPHGISYNSYVILDEKVAVLDTVDHRKAGEFLENLERVLAGRTVDYLIINHLEPDHASGLGLFLEKYPDARLVGNAKTFQMLPQYFQVAPEKTVTVKEGETLCLGRHTLFLEKYPDARLVGNAKTFQMLPQYFQVAPEKTVTVKEGETLCLGRHTLRFLLAPMVHWPEVMMTYDETDRVLFSADAFGKFGALDADEPWEDEARRYYFNIVGKFGMSVQTVLKKVEGLTIDAICPLHGPVLRETLPQVLALYDLWSRYAPESDGVLVAYASLHGNTATAANRLADLLEAAGVPVQRMDLARCDASLALAEAFRYGRMVLAASSYNGGVIPCMEDFLHHLQIKNYQKRTLALMENGSWGPSAVKTMKGVLAQMKEITVIEPAVTLRGALKDSDLPAMEELVQALLA